MKVVRLCGWQPLVVHNVHQFWQNSIFAFHHLHYWQILESRLLAGISAHFARLHNSILSAGAKSRKYKWKLFMFIGSDIFSKVQLWGSFGPLWANQPFLKTALSLFSNPYLNQAKQARLPLLKLLVSLLWYKIYFTVKHFFLLGQHTFTLSHNSHINPFTQSHINPNYLRWSKFKIQKSL